MTAQPDELGCFLVFGGPLIFIYFCVDTLPLFPQRREEAHTLQYLTKLKAIQNDKISN